MPVTAPPYDQPVTSLARTERAALADLLDAVGPDAPTLCGDWTTRDLAAHLVVRERRPDATPGIAISAFAGWTASVQDSYAERPYAELVELVRTGPGRLSPFSLPGADTFFNTTEYAVHHEDVRRAAARLGAAGPAAAGAGHALEGAPRPRPARVPRPRLRGRAAPHRQAQGRAARAGDRRLAP